MNPGTDDPTTPLPPFDSIHAAELLAAAAEARRNEREDRPGDAIGRYLLSEKVGEGGFGTVWRAEQTEPIRRVVALKLIRPGMDSREVEARFGAERQMLAMLEHPNIAAVLDAGTAEDGRPFFVMELIAGRPITEHCAGLPVREKAALFTQVCQAVQHAHQKGVIHRDLKPSNILVATVDGQAVPKVIDFGIAKALARQEEPAFADSLVRTREDMLIGTPQYMSPEQARFGASDVDTRSDVYALGVVFYELLTGTTPVSRQTFQRAGFEEMLRLVREAEPVKPSTRVQTASKSGTSAGAGTLRKLRSQLKGDLDWICLKALDKDRDRRYESAASLGADVQRHLAGEPVLASPPTLRYRAGKWIRRHRAATAVVASIAVSLVAATVVSVLFYLREREAAQREKKAAKELAHEVDRQQQRADFLTIMVGNFRTNRQVAKEVFDRALASIDTALSAERRTPDFKALNLATLAAFYSQISEWGKAAEVAEVALDLVTDGTRDLVRVEKRWLSDFSNYFKNAGKPALAEQCAREVLRRERAGADTRHLQGALERLANALEPEMKDPAEVDALWREACEIKRVLLASGKGGIGGEFGRYASFLKKQKRLGEAEAFAREQVANDDHFLGKNSPHTNRTFCRGVLADILREEEKDAEVAEVEAEIAAIRKLAGSSSQTNTAKARMSRGASLLASGKLDEAKAEYTNALNTLTSAYSKDNVDRIPCLRALATIESRKGNPTEAEALLRDALKLARTRKVPVSETQAAAELFSALAQQRRYTQGGALFAECLPLLDNAAVPPPLRIQMAQQARSFFQRQNAEQPDAALAQRLAEIDAKVQALQASLPR